MKKGFFEDGNGDRSMMRLLAFIIVINALVLVTFCSLWMILFGTDQLALTGLLVGLVGTGVGAKWAQKTTEKKKEDATD